jgi:hypothetical protein
MVNRDSFSLQHGGVTVPRGDNSNAVPSLSKLSQERETKVIQIPACIGNKENGWSL